MDATTFLTLKHRAAVDELRALEAEYIRRRVMAEATIEVTKQWQEELRSLEASAPAPSAEPDLNLQQFANRASQSWIASKDLANQVRRIGP